MNQTIPRSLQVTFIDAEAVTVTVHGNDGGNLMAVCLTEAEIALARTALNHFDKAVELLGRYMRVDVAGAARKQGVTPSEAEMGTLYHQSQALLTTIREQKK